MSETNSPYDRAIEYARNLGQEHGTNAAGWSYDGNTPAEWYARTLKGIEDGDPEILDALPAPDLSGQWADEMTGPDLVRDALSAAGLSAELDSGDVAAEYQEWFTDVCDAYETAFSTAVSDEITRVCRYQIGEVE